MEPQIVVISVGLLHCIWCGYEFGEESPSQYLRDLGKRVARRSERSTECTICPTFLAAVYPSLVTDNKSRKDFRRSLNDANEKTKFMGAFNGWCIEKEMNREAGYLGKKRKTNAFDEESLLFRKVVYVF